MAEQQYVAAKWTEPEMELMDYLIRKSGAQSRSQLLRLALLIMAEDHSVPAGLMRRVCQSRLDHPYRRSRQYLTRAGQTSGDRLGGELPG